MSIHLVEVIGLLKTTFRVSELQALEKNRIFVNCVEFLGMRWQYNFKNISYTFCKMT